MLLGVITGAHGTKGEVRLKSFTAEPDAIARYGPLEDEEGRHRAVSVRGHVRGQLIARFEGVDDRDAAERLKGVRLYVARAALPPTSPEEYYHADLIGLAAVLKDGTALGRVRAVHDFGAGDSLEVECPDGRTVFIPFTDTTVPEVDLTSGRVVVDAPPGLLEAEEDEP